MLVGELIGAISFEWDILWNRIFQPDGTFVRAMITTIAIAVVAMVVGIILGLVSELMRRSRLLPLRILSYAYVLVFRGTPLIVQIFFIYFGANLFLGFNLFPATVNFGFGHLDGAILAGTVGLAINEGAYVSEIMRSGIDAIDRGQGEAARSLGMTNRQTMRRIILPQAARVVVPPLGNAFNGMLKATSLLAFIGVYELFQDAQVHYSSTFKPAEYFTAVAIWYLVLTTVWSLIQFRIERRLAVSDRPDKDVDVSFWERLRRSTMATDPVRR